MIVYEVSYYDNDETPVYLSQWCATKQEAQWREKALRDRAAGNDSMDVYGITKHVVPTRKADFLRWLNNNA